jgi:predicted ATPase
MISSLELKNFKAFQYLDLNFGALTLLTGINGSGKSTVLQALAVLRQSTDAGYLLGGDGLLLNGELVELGTGRDVLFEHADEQSISICVCDEEGRVAGWEFTYSERDDLLQAKYNYNNAAIEKMGVFASGFQFIRADRLAPAVVFPKSYNEAVRRRFLGVRGQFAAHFLAYHQDEVVSERRRRLSFTGATLQQQVTAWLSEISPGVVVGSKEISGADLAQLSFTFGGSAGITSSNEYRPTNVGFGLTYVLPIVVSCLSARPGDLLLIENPEAHLHPRGQSLLGRLLAVTASDGVQVVVESHSEHVLNGVRISVKDGVLANDRVAIHFCGRSAEQLGSTFLSPEIRSDGRLSQWPEGFFDEWERAIMELV